MEAVQLLNNPIALNSPKCSRSQYIKTSEFLFAKGARDLVGFSAMISREKEERGKVGRGRVTLGRFSSARLHRGSAKFLGYEGPEICC